MKVYNESKTALLSSYDLSKGYLKDDKLFIKHHEKVAEKGHYETLAEYPNGGKDVQYIIDVPASEEYDEYEDIQVYVEYSDKQLAVVKIEELKAKLSSTDYQAIKYAEGELSTYDYEITKEKRRAWRKEINELEKVLND